MLHTDSSSTMVGGASVIAAKHLGAKRPPSTAAGAHLVIRARSATCAALVEYAARHGCKLVLAGDQEQLAAAASPAAGLRGLLEHLAILTRNQVRYGKDTQVTVDMFTAPTGN